MVASVFLAVFHIASTTPEAYLVEASGSSVLDFNVFYVENTLFPENPVSKNLHFFRHFTDYIEIKSGFSAAFSETFDVVYTYTAEKRFEVSYQGGTAGSNPVVFQDITEISNLSGIATTNHLAFSSENEQGVPGGTYTIRPDEYLEMYLHFLEYNEMQFAEAGEAPAMRGFAAELVVEFYYQIIVQEAGINESIRRGYRIPIGVNVFSPEPIGAPGFTASSAISTDVVYISAPLLIGFSAMFLLGGFGMYYALKRTNRETSESRQEVNSILKKYGNEIVVSTGTADFTKYYAMPVANFDELLKLALNLGKLIICNTNDEKALFYAIIDNHAFYYIVKFHKKYIPTPKDTEASIPSDMA